MLRGNMITRHENPSCEVDEVKKAKLWLTYCYLGVCVDRGVRGRHSQWIWDTEYQGEWLQPFWCCSHWRSVISYCLPRRWQTVCQWLSVSLPLMHTQKEGLERWRRRTTPPHTQRIFKNNQKTKKPIQTLTQVLNVQTETLSSPAHFEAVPHLRTAHT